MNRRKSPRHKAALDPDEPDAKPVAKLGPDIKAKIGQQLRIMYGEVVSQGVPDRFVEILRGFDDGDDAAAAPAAKKTEGPEDEPS
jgi:hypothetical protein